MRRPLNYRKRPLGYRKKLSSKNIRDSSKKTTINNRPKRIFLVA
jgi:hypothetical protein